MCISRSWMDRNSKGEIGFVLSESESIPWERSGGLFQTFGSSDCCHTAESIGRISPPSVPVGNAEQSRGQSVEGEPRRPSR